MPGERRLVKISQKYPTARSAILKGRAKTMQEGTVNPHAGTLSQNKKVMFLEGD
jgi:hypothetical protein